MKKAVIAINPKTNASLTADSITSMSRKLGVDRSTVSRAVSGDRNKLTVRGYIFTEC